MTDELSVRAAPIRREPAHPSITRDQISRLVDGFYGKVRSNSRLGPIFEARVQGNWSSHLAKMKLFWASVLLRTGEYNGRPVPVHARLSEVETDDFRLWLRLFRETVAEIFTLEAQPIVVTTAERIAASLWMAMGDNLMKQPPDWSE